MSREVTPNGDGIIEGKEIGDLVKTNLNWLLNSL